MKTRKNTKILAMILSMLMLLSCLPLTALADGPENKLHCVENADILTPAGEGCFIAEEPLIDEDGIITAYRYNLVDHMTDSVTASMDSYDFSLRFLGGVFSHNHHVLPRFAAVNREGIQFYTDDFQRCYSYPVGNVVCAELDPFMRKDFIFSGCVYYITDDWDAVYSISLNGQQSKLFSFGSTYHFAAIDGANGLLAVTMDPIGNEPGELLLYNLRTERFIAKMEDNFYSYEISKDYLLCWGENKTFTTFSLEDLSYVTSAPFFGEDCHLVDDSNYLINQEPVTDDGALYWTLMLTDISTGKRASLESSSFGREIRENTDFMYFCIYADGETPYLYITLVSDVSDANPDDGIYVRDCSTLQFSESGAEEADEEYNGAFRILYKLIQKLIKNLKKILEFLQASGR